MTNDTDARLRSDAAPRKAKKLPGELPASKRVREATTQPHAAVSSEEGRADRAMDDRAVTENRELSEEDRLDMFRQSFMQAALPDLPKISGYHVCWLTTTNPRDSIPMRLRLGYTPVKPEEVPGWEHATMKTGEYAGYIAVNEMLAFKLPERLYQAYMKEAHYVAPLKEAEKIVGTADFLREKAQRDGGDIVEGDGIQELREAPPPVPIFAG